MTKRPRRPEMSKRDDGAPSDPPEYPVGRGRPPVHTRWKPGQSGNPRGRPKGSRNVRTVLEEALKKQIQIRDGERTRSMSKLECIVTITVNRAAQGDIKHLLAVFQLLRAVGMTDEVPSTTEFEPVTERDAEIVADFVRRYLSSAGDGAADNGSTNPQGTPPGKARLS